MARVLVKDLQTELSQALLQCKQGDAILRRETNRVKELIDKLETAQATTKQFHTEIERLRRAITEAGGHKTLLLDVIDRLHVQAMDN